MAEIGVNTKVGANGTTYTKSIAGNDKLENEDFIKLMLQELKMQDPTSPMDSKEMINNQMKMSAINTNQEMIKALQNMKTSFAQSALSSASNVIGKNIEDGSVSDKGISKAYTVRSVENANGEVSVRVQEILFMENKISLVEDGKNKVLNYDVQGNILDDNGNATGKKVALNSPGEPIVDKNGKLVILDSENEKITKHNYQLSGARAPVYSDKLSTIPFSSIKKIF